MSDDPGQSPPKPLEYFHSSEPPRTHPLVLILCVIAGLIAGGMVVGIAGGVGIGAMMEGNSGHQGRWLGVIGFVAAGGFLAWGIYKLRRDRSLSIENRRRGGRFFLIGFILGCCLACLLEGICFTAFS